MKTLAFEAPTEHTIHTHTTKHSVEVRPDGLQRGGVAALGELLRYSYYVVLLMTTIV